MAEGKFISYLRVSTKRQGRSGLGLEAQRKAVKDYLDGGRWKLIEEYVEVESGKNTDRVELNKALAACRLHGATLLVAKLDRLARNAYFILGLLEARVDFVACDMPKADRLVFTILAGMAEDETRRISERTRGALAAAKARGTRLGNPRNLTNKGRRKGTGVSHQVRAAKALQRAKDIEPRIREIQAEGASTLREIAEALNKPDTPKRKRFTAPQGGKWSAVQVQRVLARLNGAE